MLLNFFSVNKDTLGVSCSLHIAQRIRVLRASNDFLSFPKYLTTCPWTSLKRSVILAILLQDSRVVMNMGSGGRPGLSVPALALANNGNLGRDT